MAMELISSLHALSVQGAVRELTSCEDVLDQNGITLHERDMLDIARANDDALRGRGRIALCGGTLRQLAWTFADSPHLCQSNFAQTMCALLPLFYELKNELEDEVPDDELMQALRDAFDGRAHGEIEALEGLSISEIFGKHEPNEEDE